MKKAMRVELKVGTLNVGTMMGKSRELADVMEEGRWMRCVSRKLSGMERRPDV